MIRLVYKCLSESKIVEKKWNLHFAFLHFKNYDNIYLNGKPLKWYHILKNGDIVEILKAPSAFVGNIFDAIWGVLTMDWLRIAGAVLGLGLIAASTLLGNKSGSGAATATEGKTYSSTTQPELTGSSNSISDGIIPVVFGETQQTPNYGQLPYRGVGDGNSLNKYYQYFIANYDNVTYTDYKLGQTPISNYSIDKLTNTISYGGSSFIGFRNVKIADLNEELSYNPDDEVFQAISYDYNETVTASSASIAYQMTLTNVLISNYSNKTFAFKITYLDDSAVEQTETVNRSITSANLTLVTGQTYTTAGTVNFTIDITEIISVSITPTVYTRGNSYENTNLTDIEYDNHTITAGTFSTNTVFEQDINYYKGVVSEVIATSPENTNEIDVIISFPAGLYRQNNDGSRSNRNININIEYKSATGEWTQIDSASALYVRSAEGIKNPLSSSSTTVSGAFVTMNSANDINLADQLFFRPIGFEVPKGKYSVRVRCADFADKTSYDIGYPYCAEIQFNVDDDIIDTSILPKVNQIALVANAYKGLSGQLQKYNYIAKANIPVWDGTNWNTNAVSQNPAAIIRYLLTDLNADPRAVTADYIDNDSLVELYNWCESQSYKASGIVSEEIKIDSVISELLSNSQAAMIPMFRGKHTFIIDKPDKIALQTFSQHNTFDFKWSPNTGRLTEAIRAAFVNEDGYVQDETTLYYYNSDVHTTPESGKSDSDYEIVKKDYTYLQNKASLLKIMEYDLRKIQEKRDYFEFKVNLEALNMMIYDRIRVSNTTNMQNESSGLIKNVLTNSGNVIGFQFYSEIDIPINANIVIRSLDYENECSVVNTYSILNSGNTDTANITPVTYDGIIRGACEITGINDKWHYDGDHFILGQNTVYDCIVENIDYGDSLTATITARTY